MRRFFLLLFALTVVVGVARGDHITVSGNVSGVWNVDTVFVAGNATVPPGQQLVIQPGVKVLFQGPYRLYTDANAILKALGAPGDSIVFTVAPPATEWRGLDFLNASPACSVSYAVITQAKTSGGIDDTYGGGIWCVNSNLKVLHSRISYCQAVSSVNDYNTGGGGIYLWYSTAVVSYCDIGFNTVGESYMDEYGGGILVSGVSEPIIEHSWIHDNTMLFGWGITDGSEIACITFLGSPSPVIYHNLIQGSTPNYYSPVYVDHGGHVRIIGNVIAGSQQPGIHVASSYSYVAQEIDVYGNIIAGISHYGIAGPTRVIGNLICSNDSGGIADAEWVEGNVISDNGGRGMLLSDSALVRNNLVCRNGGGIYIINGSMFNTVARVDHNVIFDNSASDFGGLRISSYYTRAQAENNSFYGNHAGLNAGGISCYYYARYISGNDLLWGNTPAQIYNSTQSYFAIGYSNVQNGWPGLGNISAYPAFVDTAYNDYRLLWGSPCIDSGNPDSLDPDGTRRDMGAFYFDQTVPVRVLLTPHQVPYLIPAAGGTMNFTLRLDNWTANPHIATVWCDETLPDSSTLGPLLGPVTVTVPANSILARQRTQTVPAAAMFGVYHYNAYAVVDGDTNRDSFMFGKTGSAVWDLGSGGWSCTGEALSEESDQTLDPQGSPFMAAVNPNPFNPSTALSYTLQTANQVSLRVYDTAGRLVATLAEGRQAAGMHEVRFNGSALASGVYLYRLQAGAQMIMGKMVLMK